MWHVYVAINDSHFCFFVDALSPFSLGMLEMRRLLVLVNHSPLSNSSNKAFVSHIQSTPISHLLSTSMSTLQKWIAFLFLPLQLICNWTIKIVSLRYEGCKNVQYICLFATPKAPDHSLVRAKCAQCACCSTTKGKYEWQNVRAFNG